MINNYTKKPHAESNKKLDKAVLKMDALIRALNKKEIPENIESSINKFIEDIVQFNGTAKELTKLLNKNYIKILQLVRKELKLVPKFFYQNLWMSIGLSSFGVTFGIIWYAVTKNPAMFALGIPLGLPIGIAIGARMDKKAKAEGKQLEIG